MENPFEIIVERLDRIENILLGLKPEVRIIEPQSRMLTLKQLCDYVKMAIPTVYGMTADRTIPHYKVGKKLFFKSDEIDEWICTRKIKTKLL